MVQAWGLFPASDLSALVLVSASGSPSGWGIRCLSVLELAALWDVPILVSDSLSDLSDVNIFKGFWASAPGKVLFAGTDALLTMSFRGGCYGFGEAVVGEAVVGEAVVDSVAFGPHPESNKALGLATQEEHEEDSAVRCFNELVVKGDTQKSDGVAVPDHLWLHVFLQGYGREACCEEHLQALALPAQAGVGHLRDSTPPSRGVGWQAALEGFRCLGLRWWCRNLLWGLHSWRRANVKINKGCTPGQMVRRGITSSDHQSAAFYLWSTKGRAAYRAQWRFLRSSADGLTTMRVG